MKGFSRRQYTDLIQENLPKIQTPNNEEDNAPTGNHFSPNEAFSTRIELHIIELLFKGNLKGIPKQTRLLPRLQGIVYKLMARPITGDNLHNSLSLEKQRWCLHSHLCAIVYCTGRYSTGYQKRNINTYSVTNPCIIISVQSAKYARTIVALILRK